MPLLNIYFLGLDTSETYTFSDWILVYEVVEGPYNASYLTPVLVGFDTTLRLWCQL
jgi:hypothetical protein